MPKLFFLSEPWPVADGPPHSATLAGATSSSITTPEEQLSRQLNRLAASITRASTSDLYQKGPVKSRGAAAVGLARSGASNEEIAESRKRPARGGRGPAKRSRAERPQSAGRAERAPVAHRLW